MQNDEQIFSIYAEHNLSAINFYKMAVSNLVHILCCINDTVPTVSLISVIHSENKRRDRMVLELRYTYGIGAKVVRCTRYNFI
jgi:hypothetical protein